MLEEKIEKKYENWMSKLKDEKKLSVINLPGTHDSAAYYMNRISLNFARTQSLTITKQLEIGVRLLDIRIIQSHKDTSEDEDIICCHGICDCYISPNFGDNRKLTFKSVLLDVKTFLENNPSEGILFGTFLGRGSDDTMLIRAFHLFDKYVGNTSIKFKPDLTIGDIRGKIVHYTYLKEEYDKNLNRMRTRSIDVIPNTGISKVHAKYETCAKHKINGNIKVREMKDMFEIYKFTLEEAEIKEKNKEMDFPIEYSISCTGETDCFLPNPLKEALIVHSFVQKDGVFKNGYYYGWLHMDFANITSTSILIETNFKKNEEGDNTII